MRTAIRSCPNEKSAFGEQRIAHCRAIETMPSDGLHETTRKLTKRRTFFPATNCVWGVDVRVETARLVIDSRSSYTGIMEKLRLNRWQTMSTRPHKRSAANEPTAHAPSITAVCEMCGHLARKVIESDATSTPPEMLRWKCDYVRRVENGVENECSYIFYLFLNPFSTYNRQYLSCYFSWLYNNAISYIRGDKVMIQLY